MVGFDSLAKELKWTLNYNLSCDRVIPKLTRALIKVNGLLCFTQRFVCFCSNLFKLCQKYIKLTYTILEKKNQLEFCKNAPMPATSVSILALDWQINIWDNIIWLMVYGPSDRFKEDRVSWQEQKTKFYPWW